VGFPQIKKKNYVHEWIVTLLDIIHNVNFLEWFKWAHTKKNKIILLKKITLDIKFKEIKSRDNQSSHENLNESN
jgi:hypothetical protein